MSSLADHFKGVAVKVLRDVETNRQTSNQHEFNGTSEMKCFLGQDRRTIPANFLYIGDDESDRTTASGEVTWYDARERHRNRSEHRLYFKDNAVMERSESGDIVAIALCQDDTLLIVVMGSTNQSLGELLWVLGVPEMPGERFKTITGLERTYRPDALFNLLTEELGLPVTQDDPKDDWLGQLLDKFGPWFPPTRDLSAMARATLGNELPVLEDPDQSLLMLMDREETLFRQLERYIVGQQLAEQAGTYATDVDEFVRYSLGIHNRRKSRAGHALENHIEYLFRESDLQFDRGARTENRAKPDFLFPGERAYQNPEFPSHGLSMLGVKTSCKDRWRQVLTEANRIAEKHLLTLQPGISEHQTREMTDHSLSLVLPSELHASYNVEQRRVLLSISDFITHVHEKEKQIEA